MPLTMWLSRLETANRSNAQSWQQHHALPAFTRALVAPPRALELAWPEGARLQAAFCRPVDRLPKGLHEAQRDDEISRI
jgi:hypothetical protein